jgi:membrane protein
MRRLGLVDTRIGGLCRNATDVVGHLFKKFLDDECPQRAASLAYTTLLSLVPFFAVAFAMLKAFGALAPLQERLETLVFTHLVTSSSLQVAEYIEQFTERIHAGAVGTVGLLVFLVTAVSLLNTVASAFNRVWGVEDRRSVKDRLLTFFALTILGPVLFGASISITASIRQSAVWIWMPGLGPALGFVVPFLLTWAGFLLLYEVIPSVPLRWRPALLGTFIAAITWELVKIAFEWYIGNIVNYGKVYASLGVIPIFLLWLYVSWLIALLGFEVAFFLQHPEACRGAMSVRVTPATIAVPEAIRTFVAVAESFVTRGEPLTAPQAAERARLPERVALDALAELERQGYVTRVAEPSDAYLPRRSPGRVRVADLWGALDGGRARRDGDPLDRLLNNATHATVAAFGATTVQDLIESESGGDAERLGPAREDVKELA